MHPAYSVIVFTVLSGAGYGLLAVGLLAKLFGLAPDSAGYVWSVLVLGNVLSVIGLCSSTLHLGRPERAWRAFSQWRSSWLSREGVAAVVTFAPVALTAILYYFENEYWVFFGFLSVVLSILTVYCTSKIYSSLEPISAWSLPHVPIVFIVLSLSCGLILSCLLMAILGSVSVFLLVLSILILLVTIFLKSSYWDRVNSLELPASPGSALGLPHVTSVRLLEPPHTAPNYLQREMGYRIARKHSSKLRSGFFLLLGITVLLVGIATMAGAIGASAMLVIAAMTLFSAVLVERWLFFAEARHTVSLYYGNN